MFKPIYIVGTTGSGKTALALKLASQNPSVLISADSRQVYRGMDIVPGKDHPSSVKLHGIDLVNPDEPCSVSVWYRHINPILSHAKASQKQVIVVGGTGLYIYALTQGIATLTIPPDQNLRDQLALLTLLDLKKMLKKINLTKYRSLNHSDQNNPRRLIRAIEITQAKKNTSNPALPKPNNRPLIALYYADQQKQEEVIRLRVRRRLEQGAIEETNSLLDLYDHSLPSFTALGYKHLRDYALGKVTKDQLIVNWTHAEMSYAKRQLTYFRKQNAVWYDRGRMSIEEIYEHLSS